MHSVYSYVLPAKQQDIYWVHLYISTSVGGFLKSCYLNYTFSYLRQIRNCNICCKYICIQNWQVESSPVLQFEIFKMFAISQNRKYFFIIHKSSHSCLFIVFRGSPFCVKYVCNADTMQQDLVDHNLHSLLICICKKLMCHNMRIPPAKGWYITVHNPWPSVRHHWR